MKIYNTEYTFFNLQNITISLKPIREIFNVEMKNLNYYSYQRQEEEEKNTTS